MLLDKFMIRQFKCKGCIYLKSKFTVLFRRKKCMAGQKVGYIWIDAETGICNEKMTKE